MRVADFTFGSAKLRDAVRTLRVHWEGTKGEWHDSVSREFEENYLEALEPQLTSTIDRMMRLAQMVSTAEQECG